MVGLTGEIGRTWGFEDAKQAGSLIWLNLRGNFWNEAMEKNTGSEQQNGDVYGNKNGMFTISNGDAGDFKGSHLDLWRSLNICLV